MDQYLNNRQNEILHILLANPADTGLLYISNLQSLVNEFPQSGILHVLLAHADIEQNVGRAATYFDNSALYKLVNSPEDLAVVTDVHIIGRDHPPIGHAAAGQQHEIHEPAEHQPFAGTDEEPAYHVSEEQEAELIDDITPEITPEITPVEKLSGELIPVEQETQPGEDTVNKPEEDVIEHNESVLQDTEPGLYFNDAQQADTQAADEALLTLETEPGENDTDAHSLIEDQFLQEQSFEIEEPFALIEEESGANEQVIDTVEETKQQDTETAPVFIIDGEPETAPAGIDDEVFDEIVAIEDIRIPAVAQPAGSTPPVAEKEETVQKDRPLNLNDEAEKLIVGNIAATDYFIFDRAFSEGRSNNTGENEVVAEPPQIPEPAEPVQPAAETQDVSKYHDEKMPYSFMWWLDKTRREHAGIYQPYVKQGADVIKQAGADALQQQYYENIFHLNSVDDLNLNTSKQTIEFDINRKEDVIIQRFIQEEPQIKPPSNDKLDNENKAKKSSEDLDEFVTETLARIYMDQMLYHKAINTYKKLMLKFPEKSRYFADQIELLQRKIN